MAKRRQHDRTRALVCANLARLMSERGLTAPKLAEMSGVTPVTIWTIRSGTGTASIDTLGYLADALEVHASEFFADQQSRTIRTS